MHEIGMLIAFFYALGYLYCVGYAQPFTNPKNISDLIWLLGASIVWPAFLGHIHGSLEADIPEDDTPGNNDEEEE